jgi:hypothetical protein
MIIGRKITGIIIVISIFVNTNIFAQASDWKTEKSEDGKITVASKISKRTDEESNEVQLIEYAATTIANVSFQNCIAIMKDISNHKAILNEEISEKLKTLSDNEWLIYYYFDAPWPIPNSDCVSKMNFFEDLNNGTASFTLIAAPSLYEKKDVKRVTYYNVTYTFKDLGEGKVKITSIAKLSPIIQAPDWIVKNFFPDGPARYLQRLLLLAKSA